ncbi:Trk system potassium transporter TrkA [Yunchengibacter salinarum]|uniref:Trk system potassium transporter TrkA n=1 Tax=Yunchengibacter salinarum TaxID=3133399 RepID=UPI0035B61B95
MKVIVCGAGQVGFNIAQHLADQNNDVTVIDRSPKLIRQISETLDLQAFVGFASDPEMLEQAGANDADLMIAVTLSDEVNMVACQVADSLFNVPTKVARIRNQAYLRSKWADLFARDNLPIDVIISPEMEVAEALRRRLEVPGAFNVLRFVGGRARVLGITLGESCPVVNTPLRQLTELFPKLQTNVVGVVRGERVFVPRSDDQLQVGDHVYVAVEDSMTERAMAVFGHEEQRAQRLVIVGGGNIGTFLASKLEQSDIAASLNLKLIEQDPAKAEKAAEKVENTIVINGNALDVDILREVNISQADTIVTVTNDDEVNILSALMAKKHGCRRAVALMNNPVYGSLLNSIGIDVALDPREITVSSIIRHIRRGRIRDVYSIRDGVAEIIEADVMEGSDVAGRKVSDLKLHRNARFGVIVRDDRVIVPNADTSIRVGDRIVCFAMAGAVRKIEQLFSARAEVF